MLEIRLLGPLEVRADAVSLPLGTPKQQALLAALAIRAGQVVSLAELVDELWPESPPVSAVANARSYAASLRRTFDGVEVARDVLSRRGSGYQLQIRPTNLDLTCFVDECRQVTESLDNGDVSTAIRLLDSAEGRWRGPMLVGVPRGPMLAARCVGVEEDRLRLVEVRAEVHLITAHFRAAVDTLRAHLRLHPLRERAHALLIRALYLEGDVAGALAAYTAARSALVDQLGIEPGVDLQRLHQQVLNRDPKLDPPRRGEPPADPADGGSGAGKPKVPVPAHWLPRAVADFTGRTEAVRRLIAAVERADPTAPVVQVIDGMAGSGKTTLAVHLATRLSDRYPDAQLFIDLQGHSTSNPVEPATALVTLLRQLGVPAGRIPPELDHRAALWRAELAARRAVVVLDNAGSSDQLDPLLPSAPGTLVLVTSRRRLVTFDGLPPQSLPALTATEASELLAKIVGRSRIVAEPAAAATVVRRCGRLPLAIRLAGARLAHRPGWQVADLARRLDQDTPVLAELSAQDRTLVGAFTLSYEPLAPPVRRMFRLLGLYPGEFFQIGAAAALGGLSLPAAGSVIGELVDHHLVEEPTAGRFQLHDLLRQYAYELTTTTDPPTDRHAAIEQLLDYYLHAAARVTESIERAQMRGHVALGPPLRPDLLAALVPLDSRWLEDERTNVRQLIGLAETSHPEQAWRLARLAWRFHYVRGYFDDILDGISAGLRAARRLDDPTAIAAMHNYLASAYLRIADYQPALRHLESAIEIRKRTSDLLGLEVSMGNLAAVYLAAGHPREALAVNQQALAQGRATHGTGPVLLPNLGMSLLLLGRYEESLRVQRIYLASSRDRGDSFGVALALGHLGALRVRSGRADLAVRILRAALALRARTGIRFAEAEVTNELGLAYRQLGRLDDAERQHRAALARACGSGERDVEAMAMNDLGLTLAATGDLAGAMVANQQALECATKISHPYQQGRALTAIGDHLAATDPDAARRYWERALAVFRKMGVPERLEVERRLLGLIGSTEPGPPAG